MKNIYGREDALKILLSLQYSRKEARSMVKKTLEANPAISSVEDLLTEIYRSVKWEVGKLVD